MRWSTFRKKTPSDLLNCEFNESFQNNFYTKPVRVIASGK